MPTKKTKPKPKTIIARSITIVDEEGEGQIYLYADTKSGAQIHFMNGNGPGIHLDVVQGQPSLTFWSKQKKMRLAFGCNDTTAGMTIFDPEGKMAAYWAIDPDGNVRQEIFPK